MITNKKISFAIIFILVSLIFFNIKILFPSKYITFIKKIYVTKNIDPIMKDIYVPPAQDSHPKCCPSIGRLSVLNTWDNLPPDNNIPGLLPGPRPGEQLGLENNPELSLSTPIKAPLLDNTFSNKCNAENSYTRNIKDKVLKNCLLQSNKKSLFTTLPSSLYYKYRFQQCNPYNGSYCQCTNNYIPLPPRW